MTTALKRRRGTDSNHDSFTGLDGELSVNTTNKSIHVHDGTTVGGFETMRTDFNNASDVTSTINFSGGNKVTFNTDDLEINASGGYGQIVGQTRIYTKIGNSVISEHSSSGLTVTNLAPTTTTIPSSGELKFSIYATMDISQDDLIVRTHSTQGSIYNFASFHGFYAGTTTQNRTVRASFGNYDNQFKINENIFNRIITSPGSTTSNSIQLYNSSTGTYGVYMKLTAGHQYYTPSVGYIGTNAASNNGYMYLHNARHSTGSAGIALNFNAITPCTHSGQNYDNTIALGSASARFDDAYITNGVTTGSDRNLKQDIEELSDAEQRVAQACKSLIRKYRLISSVEEKGDDARIHIGIIAQELEDAFTAEGLDASRYGMFCQDTYWWKEETIPAQEEEYQDDNDITQTRTIPEFVERTTYESEENAPDGATEVTTRSVRYTELLAFIISTM